MRKSAADRARRIVVGTGEPGTVGTVITGWGTIECAASPV